MQCSSQHQNCMTKRRLTKDEYIHVWQKNVEFDNFTHAEIAQAMTTLSEQVGRASQFDPNEIAECEKHFISKRRDWLSSLFKEKCAGYELPKPELLKILFDQILSDPDREFENGEPKRPLVQLLRKIVALAGRNHQPVRYNTWKENQESGYFGDMVD